MKRQMSLVLAAPLAVALVSWPGAAQSSQGADSGPPPLPWWSPLVEGQPIDNRPPEKADNAPLFPEQTRAPYRKTSPFKVTTLIDGLTAPWGMAFLPSGRILVTERLPGTIRMLDPDGTLSEPLAGVEVVKSPEATMMGMLDVAPDPNYEVNRRLFFAFFDVIDGTNSNTYLARATLDEEGKKLENVEVIFRSKPTIPSGRLGAKTGGRIAIDSEGMIYMTLGDRSDVPTWDVAQKLDTHLGKVIRVTPDGDPAPGNPFIGVPGALPEIWAYGTRSEEGLAFDPRTGKLWEVDHGPRGGDELNIIEGGKNYGWPLVANGIEYDGTPIGEGATHQEGLVPPIYYWDPIIAPSGLAFYTGDLFPEWKNSIFVGALRGMMLVRLEIENERVVAEEPLLTDLRTRIRDVRVGPDGAVYVLTDSGTPALRPGTPPTSKLLKLTPN